MGVNTGEVVTGTEERLATGDAVKRRGAARAGRRARRGAARRGDTSARARLVDEFLRTLDGATVVRGRCLSYGEGISYWPVTEVVKQLEPGEDESAALAAILGDGAVASSPEEIAWAFRKLLEARAVEAPLVVVF